MIGDINSIFEEEDLKKRQQKLLVNINKSFSNKEYAKFLKIARRLSSYYSLISIDPLIFHGVHSRNTKLEFRNSYRFIFDRIKNKPAYFLCSWGVSTEEPRHADFVREIEEDLLTEYPKFKFIHLGNTLRQVETFRKYELNAIFCNQNCFLDERIFKPLPDVERKYDAVYDARIIEIKRHFLAAEIKNLALIYAETDPSEYDADYIIKTKGSLINAHYFNHSPIGEYRNLSVRDINRGLNESRVGLCLSPVEGAMYASAQYLLSGLPVVSTPSLGGRDVFFDDRYVAIVEADPKAVKRGVEDLISRNVSPDFIRQNTLEKIKSHRQRFIRLVQDIYDREGANRDFQAEWDKIFFNKLLRPQSHIETIKKII